MVSFVWVRFSKPERKENFSFENAGLPLETQPKLQPRFLTLSPMRLSHNGYLELILRARRNAASSGVCNPDCSRILGFGSASQAQTDPRLQPVSGMTLEDGFIRMSPAGSDRVMTPCSSLANFQRDKTNKARNFPLHARFYQAFT